MAIDLSYVQNQRGLPFVKKGMRVEHGKVYLIDKKMIDDKCSVLRISDTEDYKNK